MMMFNVSFTTCIINVICFDKTYETFQISFITDYDKHCITFILWLKTEKETTRI